MSDFLLLMALETRKTFRKPRTIVLPSGEGHDGARCRNPVSAGQLLYAFGDTLRNGKVVSDKQDVGWRLYT